MRKYKIIENETKEGLFDLIAEYIKAGWTPFHEAEYHPSRICTNGSVQKEYYSQRMMKEKEEGNSSSNYVF
jgi:hypothetical protein